MSTAQVMADSLSYDDIVELIVDAEDTTTPWAPYQDRKILMALRELQQRRIDERVANNLADDNEPGCVCFGFDKPGCKEQCPAQEISARVREQS